MQTTKVTFISVSAFLILALVTYLRDGTIDSPAAAQAHDQGIQFTCTVGALRGPYGITTTGWIVSLGPVAEAGVITFDGVGGASQTTTISLNGTIVPNRTSLSGTYIVDPDCTGSISLTVPTPSGPAPSNLHFVIADHGRELQLVNTGMGRVLTSTAKRQ